MEGSSNCDKHSELCLRPSVTKRHKLVTLTVARCRMEMLGHIGKAQINKKKLPIRFKVAAAQTKTKTSTNGSLRRLTLKAKTKKNPNLTSKESNFICINVCASFFFRCLFRYFPFHSVRRLTFSSQKFELVCAAAVQAASLSRGD